MLNKKAAMFGLDARIALAIFGALSVISGAALYSAIQQAKVVALVAELNELGKAHEAYYLDTGVIATNTGSGQSSYWQLLENTNSLSNWNGPYTSKAKGSSTSRLAGPTPIGDYQYTTALYETGPWGADDSGAIGGPVICDDGDACSLYVGVVATESQAMAEAIDEYIDGSVDYKNGKFRIFYGTGSVYWLWYQVLPVN
tara:strand:+ start:307 stop:903 length:597 start_codon:yes stop_codon:yes gene_type:complete